MICILICTDLIIGVERKCILVPHIDTKFATSFSINKFNKIYPGMNYSEVDSLLGHPLRFSSKKISSVQPSNAAYIAVYSSDGKCKWSDFAWQSFDIYYNKDTIVISKNSIWWYD
mgnify:CR=1 FL=1